jgi:hypothetical protein
LHRYDDRHCGCQMCSCFIDMKISDRTIDDMNKVNNVITLFRTRKEIERQHERKETHTHAHVADAILTIKQTEIVC